MGVTFRITLSHGWYAALGLSVALVVPALASLLGGRPAGKPGGR
ncbi:hypothetical protein ACWEN6_39385 [Sphaerisporangium sp. NPDC004334]